MATRLDSDFVDQENKLSHWLDPIPSTPIKIRKPDELSHSAPKISHQIEVEAQSKLQFKRIYGSMLGMSVGDALGAPVEFRPNDYLKEHPVSDLQSGGTWGLAKGQFTDDTSMALCLAASLIVRGGFNLYDQLVRYKWWYRSGYMSSTGECFDIGKITRASVEEFERQQHSFSRNHQIPIEKLDTITDSNRLRGFNVFCGKRDAAGNGALMRLTPVPLFFYRDPIKAVQLSGESSLSTHGDPKSIDACRYYGALIVAAVRGETRQQILDTKFYENHIHWFENKPLHPDIMNIARGSYRKSGGYAAGIRGAGYVVATLEAVLWALYFDEGTFRKGVLDAVNLGDDTDTVAAIYGQLAGALYGWENIDRSWASQIYAKEFIKKISFWIYLRGEHWFSESLQGPSSFINVRDRDDSTSPSKRPKHSGEIEKPIEKTSSGKSVAKEKASVISSKLRPIIDEADDQISETRVHDREGEKTFTLPSKDFVPQEFKSTPQVVNWIQSLGRPCDIYADDFRMQGVTGKIILHEADELYLEKKLGVRDLKHRRLFMKNIIQKRREIREKYGKTTWS